MDSNLLILIGNLQLQSHIANKKTPLNELQNVVFSLFLNVACAYLPRLVVFIWNDPNSHLTTAVPEKTRKLPTA
jgi:hypothetical protein